MFLALPTLRAATDPTVRPGDYFGPDGLGEMTGSPVVVTATPVAHDQELASWLDCVVVECV